MRDYSHVTMGGDKAFRYEHRKQCRLLKPLWLVGPHSIQAS